jgi:hypothetical protein
MTRTALAIQNNNARKGKPRTEDDEHDPYHALRIPL